MQTFLTLRSLFLRFKQYTRLVRGFTLVEVVIVVAIIGLISAIIIPRYAMFDSTTLLNSAAYDIASSIRQAQVYSLSVRGSSSFFDYPFGVSFNTESLAADPDHNVKNYILFQFEDETAWPEYNLVDTQNILVTPLERTMEIHDLCVEASGNVVCDGIDRLDVSFRRPEFEAIFHIEGSSPINDTAIESAYIKLKSSTGSNVWMVRVGLFGDISVCQESSTANACII